MKREVMTPPPIEKVLEHGSERRRSVSSIFKEMVGVGLASFVLLEQSHERGRESGRQEGAQAGWRQGYSQGVEAGRWEKDARNSAPSVSEYNVREFEGGTMLEIKVTRFIPGTESTVCREQYAGTIPLQISVGAATKFGEGKIEITLPHGSSDTQMPPTLANLSVFYVLNPDGSSAEVVFRSSASGIAFSLNQSDKMGITLDSLSGELDFVQATEEKVEVVEVKAGKPSRNKH